MRKRLEMKSMAISKNNSRIILTVSKDLKAKIINIAKKEECSVSKVCAKIISDYMDRKVKH